jgi:hypothetical protein
MAIQYRHMENDFMWLKWIGQQENLMLYLPFMIAQTFSYFASGHHPSALTNGSRSTRSKH